MYIMYLNFTIHAFLLYCLITRYRLVRDAYATFGTLTLNLSEVSLRLNAAVSLQSTELCSTVDRTRSGISTPIDNFKMYTFRTRAFINSL